MIHTVSLDTDGGVQVHAGRYADNDSVPMSGAVARVPAAVFVTLGLFDEGRPGFDWDVDAGRATEMLIWALEDAGLDPASYDELEQGVLQLCLPGGPAGGPFQIELKPYGE